MPTLFCRQPSEEEIVKRIFIAHLEQGIRNRINPNADEVITSEIFYEVRNTLENIFVRFARNGQDTRIGALALHEKGGANEIVTQLLIDRSILNHPLMKAMPFFIILAGLGLLIAGSQKETKSDPMMYAGWGVFAAGWINLTITRLGCGVKYETTTLSPAEIDKFCKLQANYDFSRLGNAWQQAELTTQFAACDFGSIPRDRARATLNKLLGIENLSAAVQPMALVI